MSAFGLTSRQKECFDFIRSRLAADGIAPSVTEMREHLGLGSKSGVMRLIVALEERGCIERLPYRSRAIRICSDADRETRSALRVVLDRLDLTDSCRAELSGHMRAP